MATFHPLNLIMQIRYIFMGAIRPKFYYHIFFYHHFQGSPVGCVAENSSLAIDHQGGF